MTDAFYNDVRDNVADDLIKQFGKSMTMRAKGSGQVFDGATGFVTTVGTNVDYPVSGVMTKFNQREIDGTNILRDDFKLLMSANNRSTGAPLAVEPDTSMQIIDGNGEVYAIVHVEPLRPGNIDVIYTLQVRR